MDKEVSDQTDNSAEKPQKGGQQQSKVTTYLDSCTSADAKCIDMAIADFFYEENVAFRKIESKAFKKMISSLRPSYGNKFLYGATKLRTNMLEVKYTSLMDKVMETIKSAEHFSIITDGWTSCSKRHFVNIIIHTPNSDPFYLKTVDVTDISLDNCKMTEILVQVAKQIGEEKWLSCVMDNARVNVVTGDNVENNYPSVFMMGCSPHNYNLMIKDICKQENSTTISRLVSNANSICSFISNSYYLNNQFNQIRQQFGIKKSLEPKVETRFSSNVRLLQSVLLNRSPLKEMIFTEISAINRSKSEQKNVFINTIKDEQFWEDLVVVIKILEPISEILKLSESNTAYIESEYSNYQQLKHHFQTVEDIDGIIDRSVLIKILYQRWNFIHVPAHGFAFVLNPSTAKRPMEKGMCPVRNKRFDDYKETIIQLKLHIKHFYNNKEDQTIAINELEKFSEHCGHEDECSSPRAYWAMFGRRDFPKLSRVALRLFQVIISSCAAERCWSIAGDIMNKKRNRMTPETFDKLLAVKINSILLNQTQEENSDDEF